MVTYVLKLSRSPIFNIGNDNIQSDQSFDSFIVRKLWSSRNNPLNNNETWEYARNNVSPHLLCGQ